MRLKPNHAYYNFPDTEIQSIAIVKDNYEITVNRISVEDMEKLYLKFKETGALLGIPTYYSYDQHHIKFWPVPDAAYEAKLVTIN